MEFIGEKGISAPLLRDMDNSEINFNEYYHQILAIVWDLYNKVELVHADLSEYNIMVWKDTPVFIDFSQSVHREHPSSETFLKRDLNNLNIFFSKHGVKTRDTDELIKWVMKS